MAEEQILTTLAAKLGIKNEKIIKKAHEHMRLADIRSASSSLASLSLSGSCKAVMCLELAAVAYGDHVDRSTTLRVSGMKNKKIYLSALRSMECMLDLQTKVSVTDLTLQFSCPGAKQLTMQVLKKYQDERAAGDTTEYSQVLFNAAAMYAVCRRQKQKVDKTKIVDLTGVKRMLFDKLVAHMDKLADSIMKKQQKETKTKRTAASSFLDQIEKAADDDLSAKRSRETDTQATEEEPYLLWKERILQEAYKALGKTYQANS